jgi:hypothetical protein
MVEKHYGEIFAALRADGWEAHEHPSLPWVKLKPRAATGRRFEVNFTPGPDSCRFELVVAQVQPKKACLPALSSYLLLLNHQLRLTTLSLDAGGLVHMSASVPASCANTTSFGALLGSLRACFNQFHEEIELLATQEPVARLQQQLFDDQLLDDVSVSVVAPPPTTDAPPPSGTAVDW